MLKSNIHLLEPKRSTPQLLKHISMESYQITFQTGTNDVLLRQKLWLPLPFTVKNRYHL